MKKAADCPTAYVAIGGPIPKIESFVRIKFVASILSIIEFQQSI